MAGYQTAITIKELRADDIPDLERFARTIPDIIGSVARNQSIDIADAKLYTIYNYFLALYDYSPENFCFGKGEKTLIQQIVKFVNSMVAKGPNGALDFSYFKPTLPNRATTKQTAVGRIFKNASDKQHKDEIKLKQKSGIQAERIEENAIESNIMVELPIVYAIDSPIFKSINLLLQESLLISIKCSLNEYLKEHPAEFDTMRHYGVSSVNDLQSSMMSIDADALNKYFAMYSQVHAMAHITLEQSKQLIMMFRANVHCYCKAKINVNFRSNKRFEEMVNLAHNDVFTYNQFSIETLAKAWNTCNFRRHLRHYKHAKVCWLA